MAGEVEELVGDTVDEIAVKEVVLHANERKKDRWQVWLALSSSLLAVLSVVAALLANFASDDAALALSNDSDFSGYADAVDTSRTMLRAKIDLLVAMGKPITDSDVEELKRMEAQAATFRERSSSYERQSTDAFRTHDSLAIAVTLFQVTMLLSGVAVMMNRVSIWRFGLAFSALGLVFFARGVAGYLG
jgi:hypothetical protein